MASTKSSRARTALVTAAKVIVLPILTLLILFGTLVCALFLWTWLARGYPRPSGAIPGMLGVEPLEAWPCPALLAAVLILFVFGAIWQYAFERDSETSRWLAALVPLLLILFLVFLVDVLRGDSSLSTLAMIAAYSIGLPLTGLEKYYGVPFLRQAQSRRRKQLFLAVMYIGALFLLAGVVLGSGALLAVVVITAVLALLGWALVERFLVRSRRPDQSISS